MFSKQQKRVISETEDELKNEFTFINIIERTFLTISCQNASQSTIKLFISTRHPYSGQLSSLVILINEFWMLSDKRRVKGVGGSALEGWGESQEDGRGSGLCNEGEKHS